MKKIIVATRNKGKVSEFKKIMDGYDVITQAEAGIDVEVIETGATFEENALIKARAISLLSGEDVIADDSGLEVFCLDGRPGIYSARYGGEDADDSKKMELLNKEIDESGSDNRDARFVSVIALVKADGSEHTFRGECAGSIIRTPKGDGGFGYDPIFYVEEYDRTFAQMPADLKNKISHRAMALEKLKEYFENTKE